MLLQILNPFSARPSPLTDWQALFLQPREVLAADAGRGEAAFQPSPEAFQPRRISRQP